MSASFGVRPATCARKRRYATKRGAKAAIVSVLTNSGGRAMNAYRCEVCGAWHIGHRPAWSRATTDQQRSQVKVTAEVCDEIIEYVGRVRDDLRSVYDLDRQLAQLERPDGFRTSVRPMEGSRPSSDAEGDPLPPHSDSTGSTVVARVEDRASCVRREINVMNGAVNEMLTLARQADGARSRALEPAKEHVPPDGCRNHEAHGLGWEPVHAAGRCRWCYDFLSVEGVDAPKELLEKRSRGQRVNAADVERALAHRHSQRARKRRRKAG